jgi:4-amino-4-deoxy-L-arabinose transferase-like glycosyltransferase
MKPALRIVTTKRRLILFAFYAACVAGSGYLSVRPYLLGSPLIGHADQANIANLARSYAEGRGLVVDNVWLHVGGGLPGNKVTGPEPYWSIYTALAIAPFFYLFGASIVSMLVPALISKALITAITAFWVWRLTGRLLPTVAAMVFVSFSPVMLAVVTGLSDIYLTLGMLATGSVLVFAILRKRYWLFVLAGILCGVSIGMKPSGILLLGVWPVYFLLMPERKRIALQGLVFLAGVVAALAPYLHYNYKHFGTLIPPGIPFVARAMEVRHYYYWIKGEQDALSRAVFSPESDDSVPEGGFALSLDRYRDHFESFLGQILIEGSVCPMWLTPFVFVGIFGLLWPLPRRRELSVDATKLMMYFGLLMFGAGVALAFRQHFEARYWNFLFPFCVLVAIPYLQKLPKTVYFAMIAIALASGFMWSKKFKVPQLNPEYATAEQLLPDDAVVLTASPWQFAFHTRIPAVATPHSPDPLTIKSVAERYGADYLVFFGDGRHELHKKIDSGELQLEFLEPVHRDNRLTIFRIKRGDASRPPASG